MLIGPSRDARCSALMMRVKTVLPEERNESGTKKSSPCVEQKFWEYFNRGSIRTFCVDNTEKKLRERERERS